MLSIVTGILMKKAFNMRFDGHPKLRYPSPEEYGCSAKKFAFYSGKNLLRGEKLYVGDISKCKRCIVFFHGAGAGHTAYSSEIAYFAKKGFLVYAYDNTGCMESEGKTIGNLAQSVADADAFFSYLPSDEDYHDQPIYAVGHSWGGLACVHCLDERLPVKKCVSLAGINELSKVLAAGGGLPSWMSRYIRRYLRLTYGKDAVNQKALLQECKKPFLYYIGDKDFLMLDAGMYSLISEFSKQNPNISTVILKNKGHNCYWNSASEDYLHDLRVNKHFLELNSDPEFSFDIDKIKDDRQVMDSIVDFLIS